MVRRQHQGAARPSVGDPALDQVAGRHVERRERLVEEQEVGLLESRAREGEALAHAGGEGVDRASAALGEADVFEELLQLLARPRSSRMRAHSSSVLDRGQPLVQEGVVGDQGETSPAGERLCHRVETEHPYLTCAAPNETRDTAQERRLPRAVRAGEQEELARVEIEIDVSERPGAAKAPSETPYRDSGRWHAATIAQGRRTTGGHSRRCEGMRSDLRGLLVAVVCAATAACSSVTGNAADPPAASDARPASFGPGPDDLVAMLLLLEDRRLYEPMILGRALASEERDRVAVAATLGRLADPRGEDALLLLLRDESAAVRRAAAHSLQGFGSPLATDALLLAAADPDRETGVRALRALATAGAPLERVAVALRELPEEEIWRRLVPALSLFPEAARRELAEAGLSEAPVELRAALAVAVLHDPAPASVPLARSLIAGEDPFVRGYAARVLGALGSGAADLALLAPLFRDEAFPASEALAAADRLLRDGRAAPPAPWAEALPELALEARHPDVEVAVCLLLRHYVFAPGVADALYGLAQSDRGPAVLGAAIEALLWAAEPRGFDLLGAASLSSDSLVRSESARLLGDAAWPLDSLVPLQALLDRLLGDRESGVRAAALRSLFARIELLQSSWVRERALALRADRSGVVRADLYVQLALHPLLGYDELVATAGARLDLEPDPVARRVLVAALERRAVAERLDRGATIALLERVADEDPSHFVRGRLSEALLAFGRPAPAVRPVHSLDQVGAYREVVQRTGKPLMATLVTSRGPLRLRLECPLAPKSCLSFVQLAVQGSIAANRSPVASPAAPFSVGTPPALAGVARATGCVTRRPARARRPRGLPALPPIPRRRCQPLRAHPVPAAVADRARDRPGSGDRGPRSAGDLAPWRPPGRRQGRGRDWSLGCLPTGRFSGSGGGCGRASQGS